MTFDRKYNCVYMITNNVTGMMYIGCHSTDNLNDYYMGSGKNIKQDLKKYGRYNFTKEILATFDTCEEARNLEKKLVNRVWCNRTDTYNNMTGGTGRKQGYRLSEETKKQIAKTMKGRKRGKYNVAPKH